MMTKLPGLAAAVLCVSVSLTLLGGLTSAHESQISSSSSRPPTPYAKLQSSLANLASTYDVVGLGPAVVAAAERELLADGGSVQVVVWARSGKEAAALAAVRAAGGRAEVIQGDDIQAVVPLPALESLAASEAVRFVHEPIRLLPQAVVSEGAGLSGVSPWHNAGFTGAGTKVAILDLGFKGYTSLLGSELPANVITRSFTHDGQMDADEHGTACAEIVHDMAPAAQLYLVAAGTLDEGVEATSWLMEQGVDVVSASISNPVGGPGDGTGPLDAKVDEATARGILWVNSAGNSGQHHWSGKWKDQDGDGLLEFGAGDESNAFTLLGGERAKIYLKWNDPWESSCNDYDLFVYDSSGSLVSSGTDIQDCSMSAPWEGAVALKAFTDDFSIKVKRVDADGQATFDLFVECGGTCLPLEHLTPEGSISPPGDAAGALAVGAVDVHSPGAIEPFSSRGPTKDGRIKPDLVAPDQVSTVSYGPEPFGGTSASAPHVAGAAALVKQANPGFSPQQMRAFLEGRAVDLGSSGKDNVYGSGRLSLGAVPGPGPSPTPGATRTPTRTPTRTATPTPTTGLLQNCPDAGKWAMSAWDGQGGIAAEQALATCSGRVEAAYWLNPDTQGWLRYVRGLPAMSNLGTLNASQAILALGSASGSAQAGTSRGAMIRPASAVQQAGRVEDCPQAAKWAMSTWSGPNNVNAAEALTTCSGGVEAAYWLNPDTQDWLRYLRGFPDVSNLGALNHMQAFYTLGSAVPPTATPTPALSPTPRPTVTPTRTPTSTATVTAIPCPEPGTYSGLTSGGGLFEFDVEECSVTTVRIAEWVTCIDWLDATAVAEITYDPPLPIVSGAFSGQGSQSEPGLYDSWWLTKLQFSGQFTSSASARGQVDIQVEITGWPEHDTIYCDTEPPLTWRVSHQ
jgi:hypothetical protein